MTGPQSSTAVRHPGRLSRAGVIALLVLVLVIPTVLQFGPVRSALADARVLPRPASFSSLGFLEANDLDETVEPDGQTRFSFVATNQGEDAKTYTWTVSVAAGADPPGVVRSGRLTLAGNETATVPVQLTIERCRKRNVITVALDGPDERSPSISYPVLWHGGSEWKASGGPSCG